jgi:hypothetical protein
LDPKKPVDGIVFVAGGGLITLREALARETSISKGYDTIHRWQELSLAAELDDLAQICASIRQTKRVSRNPKWLLVATTKIDLLYDQIGAVKDYYSPNGSSAFSKLLNDLKEDVGRDNFEWDAVPVCSHLENFQWGNEILPTQLDASASVLRLT